MINNRGIFCFDAGDNSRYPFRKGKYDKELESEI
jgi:hypothetical protein